jgi:hypothetical protein
MAESPVPDVLGWFLGVVGVMEGVMTCDGWHRVETALAFTFQDGGLRCSILDEKRVWMKFNVSIIVNGKLMSR